MKRKKVLYIGNALTHKNVTVTTIETLSTSLREEGYDVIVVSCIKNKIGRFLDMISAVRKHRKHIDIVLIDTYSTTNYWYAVYVAKLCRLYKIPYIPILHGGNLPERIRRSVSSARKLFQNAYINIAPSHYLMEAFQKEGYTNIRHIPNTIDLSKYPFKERERYTPKLLWVRSFATIYNPMMALQVLQELQKTYPEATLTMIGPKKDESFDRCSAFAKAHNLPVTFTGKLSKEAWISLAASHDIFINTTNFDNTPVSIIEAMALGLPVVSTNVGGIPFLIKDTQNGLLCPPENIGTFVEKLILLIDNTDIAREISVQARESVQNFDWRLVKISWNEVLS
ncbi:glycosyltransferase family 4 protein [uncultured Dokdonia sp.]|uniref:glycosyltransferase family 4 protein n=1 Tax=uncultured Dokdonia sp. TaxID=575653 RepID=UPI0026303918|nr:glycosyltransferase family 4 protein [uncultured Dokdonia sp.]